MFRGKQLAFSRLMALLCLCALLTASLAAPIHKHDSSRQDTCLLCHVTEHRGGVAIANDIGKPVVASSNPITSSVASPVILEPTESIRIPRAPPFLLVSTLVSLS